MQLHIRQMIILMLAMITITIGASPAVSQTLQPVPAQDELLKQISSDHPRLLATRADFVLLKQRIESGEHPLLSQWHEKLLARAAAIEKQQPIKVTVNTTGKRVVLTGMGQLRHRLYTLGMLYQLHGDENYVALAWRDIDAAITAPDWNPRHFLGVAETSRSIAIAYDWLYQGLSPAQRKAIEDALEEKALSVALAAYEGRYIHGWWPAVTTNWNQVCNGAMGMAAIAMADAKPQLAAQVLTYAIRLVPIAMTSYAPDGASPEGIAYWGYGGDYNVQFIAALDSALNTDYGLSTMPGYDKTALFPIMLTGPTGFAYNYGDAPYRARSARPEMLWFAKRFNNPAFAAFYLPRASGDAMDMLWYDPAIAKQAQPMIDDPAKMNLPRDHRFAGSDVFTFRSSWTDPAATYIAFKAGDNQFNHSQLDLGSFVLDALGQRFIVDLGSDSYSLPDYFHSKRWTFFRNRTEAHNTLLLNHDGAASPGQDPKASARVISFDVNDDENHATTTIDLTDAYRNQSPAPQQVTRTFTRDDRRVTITDRIVCDTNQTSIHWLLYTPADITIERRDAVLTIKDQRLLVRVTSPENVTWQTEPATPFPDSPNPPGQNPNKGITRLMLHLEKGKWQSPIIVMFIPMEAGQSPADVE